MGSKLAKLFINNLRHKLGDRSAYWLAKESGLAQSTISRLFSGEADPSLDSLEAISNALVVHPLELLNDKSATMKVEKTVTLEKDQFEAVKHMFEQMQESKSLESPELTAIAHRVPKDIQLALANWSDDWNFIRAALDLPEVKTSKKNQKAT